LGTGLGSDYTGAFAYNAGSVTLTISAVAVPEPGAVVLLFLGCSSVGLALWRQRKLGVIRI